MVVLLIAILLFLLLVGMMGRAQVMYREFDGRDWQRMTEKEKIAYVRGFVSGVENNMARIDYVYCEELPARLQELIHQTHCFYFIWPEQIKEFIEKFYMDKKNLNVRLHDAMYAWNVEEEEDGRTDSE